MKKKKQKDKDKLVKPLIDLTEPLLVCESFENENLIYYKGKLYLKRRKDEDKASRISAPRTAGQGI